jgi:RHS repeat-associated protein
VIPASSSSSYNLVQRTDLTATVRHIRTRTTGGTIATRFEYVHRDHLGSVDALTDSNGVLLNNKTSYDAFAGRREASWGSDVTPANLNTIISNEDERFARGYTDHEQLNRTGFIHMNGRVYDPRIGRFVSADPIVQAPFHSQSYNRYSYTSNNPLSYIDPSGFGKVKPSSNKLIDGGTTAPPGQTGVPTVMMGYTGDYFGGTTTATVTYSAPGASAGGASSGSFGAPGGSGYQEPKPNRGGAGTSPRTTPPRNSDGESEQPPAGEKPCDSADGRKSFGDCLAGCTSDQLGLTAVAGALIGAGAPLPGSKRFRTPSSSIGTSVFSKALGTVLPMRMTRGIPTPPTWARPGAFGSTAVLGRAVARWIPFVGWGLLAYDAASIAICTSDCMNAQH